MLKVLKQHRAWLSAALFAILAGGLIFFLGDSSVAKAATPAIAEVRATADDAIALVKKATARIKEAGREKAFAEISDPKGQFVNGSLYIFVYDLRGNSLAIGNGNASKMVGKNLSAMRDTDGKYLIKELIEVASSPKGKGWVDYKWPNPLTKAIESKSSYVEKCDGDLMVGAGIYK